MRIAHFGRRFISSFNIHQQNSTKNLILLFPIPGVRVPDSRRQAAPAYSFGTRRNQGQCDSIGPGPAQYNVSGLGAKGKDTPPAMSLQSRPKAKSHFNTPAPGDYNVEKNMVGSAPKYTFGLKTVADKPKDTPG